MLSADQAFDTPHVSAGMKGPGAECRWSEREPQRYWPLVFAYIFFCLPFPVLFFLTHPLRVLAQSSMLPVVQSPNSDCFSLPFCFLPVSLGLFLNRVKGVPSLSRCGIISSQLCAVTCGAPFPRCWPSRPWRRCWHRLWSSCFSDTPELGPPTKDTLRSGTRQQVILNCP